MLFSVGPEILTWGKGLITGGSLIVAIGAQNAFVLAQGLRQQYHWMVATICALADLVLISLGVYGAALIISQSEWLAALAYWGGISFLTVYGLLSFKSAMKDNTLQTDKRSVQSRKSALLTTLAVSLLNPHVYLDVVVLLGGIGNQYPADLRSWFTIGAISASILWFYGLSLGARWLAPLFEKPIAWRILDAAIGIIMLSIAWNLLQSPLASQ